MLEDQKRALTALRQQIDDAEEEFARGDYIEITDEFGHRALFNRLKAEVLKRADYHDDVSPQTAHVTE